MSQLMKISDMGAQLQDVARKSIKPVRFYMWMTLVIFLKIIMCTFFLINKTFDTNISDLFFGMIIIENKYEHFASLALATFRYVFFVMPIYTFATYYVTTCHQVKTAIFHFSKNMIENSNNSKYDKLCHSYITIRSAVEFVDQNLSFLVFCNITYCFSYMYKFVSQVLQAKEPLDTPHLLYISSVFSNILLSFVAMTVAASLVGEASLEVESAARRMLQSSQSSTFTLRNFYHATEREINLTVWKIVPIRRSFIIGTIGSLFTYVMLFHSLKI